MITADTITDEPEGPPVPTYSYARRLLQDLVVAKRWQHALDLSDSLAVHPHIWSTERQSWFNGFGDAMHMLVLAELTARRSS